MKTRYSEPYETTAKFNSSCSSCKKQIKKGDAIVYDKYRGKVYCSACGDEVMQGVRAERSMEQYGTDIY